MKNARLLVEGLLFRSSVGQLRYVHFNEGLVLTVRCTSKQHRTLGFVVCPSSASPIGGKHTVKARAPDYCIIAWSSHFHHFFRRSPAATRPATAEERIIIHPAHTGIASLILNNIRVTSKSGKCSCLFIRDVLDTYAPKISSGALGGGWMVIFRGGECAVE